MIINLFPYILVAVIAYFPALFGVFACDKLVNKSDNWFYSIFVEVLFFGFAFAFSFVETPIELPLIGIFAIPPSFVGTMTIGYGAWVKKNEAEYCGKERLYFYSVASLFSGLILLAIRLFWGIYF